MEYDNFANKFWPLLGQRVYETDQEVVRMIFNKAAEYADEEQREILAEGPESGWRCGQTKLFMKDQARFGIEAALNRLLSVQATKI